ncbi:MAG: LLM class flavin-dependent oxidoreductase [Novosphingobium sp.]|nr:LLM class flavin-dependent oxidoreductase [Novosphingobium sp.]
MGKPDSPATQGSERGGPTIGLMLPAIANTDDGKIEPRRLLTAARSGEAAGFDGVYVGDHLMHPNPLLESLTSLASIAAVTEHISIGTCVLLAALRDPMWLAKQLGTIDAFAPGRLRVGIGLGGEYPAEFEQAGVPLAERGIRTEQILSSLRQWLSAGQPNFGSNASPMHIAPVPETPPPFLLAGWKEVALRRAARIADGWIGYLLSPESFARRRSFLLDCGAGQTRPFVTGMLLPVLVDQDRAAAKARAGDMWKRITGNDAVFPERLFVAGPPAEIIDQLLGYRELGCTEMVLSLVDQGHGFARQLDMLGGEVLPELRRLAPPAGLS